MRAMLRRRDGEGWAGQSKGIAVTGDAKGDAKRRDEGERERRV